MCEKIYNKQIKNLELKLLFFIVVKMDTNLALGDDVDAEAMEVLNELNLLSETENQQSDLKEASDWNKSTNFIFFYFQAII